MGVIMNSIVSQLILTIFTLTLQVFIDFKQRFTPANLSPHNPSFYPNIFYPLLGCGAMFFISLIITLCLAIQSQKNSARRLRENYQPGRSSHTRYSVQFDMEDPVNDRYTTQLSASFSELLPSAPEDAEVSDDMITPSEDPLYPDRCGSHLTVMSPVQIERSPSLSRAFARVRESIVGVNSQFECPVCYEEMRPPVQMFQCRQGHVVCQMCKHKGQLTQCPSCRGQIVGRNFAMENLAEEY